MMIENKKIDKNSNNNPKVIFLLIVAIVIIYLFKNLHYIFAIPLSIFFIFIVILIYPTDEPNNVKKYILEEEIKEEIDILKEEIRKEEIDILKEEIRKEEIDILEEEAKIKREKRYILEAKIKKGKEYEFFIMNCFKRKGYKVYPKGYIEGKLDKGIDIIAYKENEILLIQCKHWLNTPRQKDIKIFITDCEIYIKKNKINNKEIRKLFVTSNKEMDYGVKCFLDEYNSLYEIKIEYLTISMK